MKVGFWLNGGSGKLAGATVYKQNGETVMREVVTPKNANTTAQILQRIIMHTVMGAYSKMKDIVDHSFEGTDKGQKTMSLFMKENIQLARQKIASMQADGVDFYDMYNFTPLGVRGFSANSYLIAMGSLPSVSVTLNDNYDGMILSKVTAATYQNIIDQYNLQRGDQLTFMFLKYNGEWMINNTDFVFARVILDPTDPDTHLPLPLSTSFLNNNLIAAPSVRNENADILRMSFIEGVGLVVNDNSTRPLLGAAVIVSRKSGDLWQRSTTKLTYVSGFGYSLGECMDNAANGVSTEIYTNNSVYLNNAGQGGGTAAATGESSDAGTGEGDSSTTPTLSSLSVNGTTLTVGTQRTISVTNGTTFPTSLAIAATGTNVSDMYLIVKQGSTEVRTIAFSGNSASDTVSGLAKDTVYTIELQNEDREALATGYSFIIEELAAGDGNDDPIANDH